jgi:Glycogen recognition site of AMP-activated protein kinase
MGNSPSKSPPGNPHAPSAGPQNASGQERRVNRRTSINALSGSKASAADPSASKESATGQPASHGVATVQQRLQSRNIPHATQAIYEVPDRTNRKRFDGRYQAGAAVEVSSPVQVPSATNRSIPRRDEGYMPISSSANPANTYYSASHLQRPPRLPLPIGDANATPGSPDMAPVDSQVDSESFELLDNKLATAAISLDDTHVDEDEVDDEMLAYAMHGPGSKAVPTVIEWGGPGDQVFVTGTFVNWEKKFRLHKRYKSEICSSI